MSSAVPLPHLFLRLSASRLTAGEADAEELSKFTFIGFMTEREPIHPEYPFTEAENAAAWILLGVPAETAIADSEMLRVELANEFAESSHNEEDGWFALGPRVHFEPVFGAAIHLAADIHSGRAILSELARRAWLDGWTVILSDEEAERRIAQLALLGPSWSLHRGEFFRLLTRGRLP